MHTTVQQNKAHREDMTWKKIAGAHGFADRRFNSGYAAANGWSIRKGWEMTGHDWHIYNADGQHVGRAHSLTWAKMDASEMINA